MNVYQSIVWKQRSEIIFTTKLTILKYQQNRRITTSCFLKRLLNSGTLSNDLIFLSKNLCRTGWCWYNISKLTVSFAGYRLFYRALLECHFFILTVLYQVQPIAFGVSFILILQSQSPGSLFNGTWQKRPRELEQQLRFEIEKNDTPNAIGCATHQ